MSRLFKNPFDNTKALRGLRYAAIDADNMDNCVSLDLVYTVVNRAAETNFLFMHFPLGPDHRQVNH